MNKIPIASLALVIWLFSSCNLSDNSSPEEGSNKIEASDLLKSSIAQMAFNHNAIGSRTTATILQYYGDFDNKVNSFQGYLFSPFYFEPLWSEGFYAGSLVNIKELRSIATAEDNEILNAIGMILQAHEFMNLTLMFGDIPYTESLQGNQNITPVYDSQQSVLTALKTQLEEAIIKLQSEGNLDILTATGDLIYGGDKTLWIKFAYGLKARLLLNQLNKNNIDLDEIFLCLENSFQNEAEQASFHFTSDFSNPQYRFAVERPSSFYLGEFFRLKLDLSDDPRIDFITQEIGGNWIHFSNGNFEPKYFQEQSTIPLLSYTEILFMKAEISLRKIGNGPEAKELFEQAILSSIKDHEIEMDNEVDFFIGGISDITNDTYDNAVRQIIEQSYIAYYGFNHLQAWCNYRRTGYPELSSSAENPNELNPSNSVPLRFLYPSSEYEYNLQSVTDALARQEGALLDSELWIFR